MQDMKIVDIYQPVDQGIDQEHLIPEYYFDEQEALKRCNGFGQAPKPKKHLGLAVPVPNGPPRVFLFASSTPIDVFHTTDEMKKARALSKLTPEERALLGV